MSTVETEQAIGPCPICGPLDEHDAPHLRRFNHICVLCPNCGAEGSKHFDKADAIAAWNRLSDAAALARAVERLDKNIVHMSANVIGGELQPLVWLVQSQHGKVRAERLAAALIALAEQVNE